MGKLARALRRAPDWRSAVYVVVCAAAALAPLVTGGAARAPVRFPGWPSHFDGHELTRLPDPPEEAAFYAGLALRHARFSDGRRMLLLRWADTDVGGFHLSDACFRAYGYTLGPFQHGTREDGRPERCFVATRETERLEVCEHIRDATGRSFGSTEEWRREHLLRRAEPPFWGVSVVTPLASR